MGVMTYDIQNNGETQYKAMADAMHNNGMQSAGWSMIGPDINWARGGRDGSGNLQTSALFPSGMHALGSYIHAYGLQFAMYLAPGTTSCGAMPGSAGHEAQDASLMASYGADFIKYDSCTNFGSKAATQTAYQKMLTALKNTGRTIRFQVSCPVYNGADCPHNYQIPQICSAIGGAEVTTGEDQAGVNWATLKTDVDDMLSYPYGLSPACWPKIDYLGVGGALTDTEGRANFSLFSIFAADLWTNVNIVTISSTSLATLTNAEVIAVDQDSLGVIGSRVSSVQCGDEHCNVYAKQLSDGWAVVLWNRSSTKQSVTATWAMFNQTGSFDGRDLWAHSDLGQLASGYTASIPSHGVVMLKLVSTQPSFSISASPASLTIAQGNHGTSTITPAISNGFNSAITLSASGVPTGTTVKFNPNPIPAPGSGNSTMTITVGSSTPVGTYPITVTGKGGGIQENTTVTLSVTGQGQVYDVGINFRSTKNYVTDPAYAVFDNCLNDGTNQQTRTNSNGYSISWQWSQKCNTAANESASVDPRLAGIANVFTASGGETLTITVPQPGTYNIGFATGNAAGGQCGAGRCPNFIFKDGASGTQLFTVNPNNPGTGHFIDAANHNWTAAQWPTSNQEQQVTLTGTTLTVSMAPGYAPSIAHIRLTYAH